MITDIPPDWRILAACTPDDDRLRYGRPGESPAERAYRESAATQMCTGCPVLADCAGYAVERKITRGVWGGLREADLAYILAAIQARARTRAAA